jgi:hypothetical protein
MATFGSYIQAGNASCASRGPSNNIQNHALGCQALLSNSSGNYNVGIGFRAIPSTNGIRNIGIGNYTLENNGGSDNIAIGQCAGRFSNGSGNTFIGFSAGRNASGAGRNTFVGVCSGAYNTGQWNTGLGANTLRFTGYSYTTSVGYGTGTLGNESTAIGFAPGASCFATVVSVFGFANACSIIIGGGFVSNDRHTKWGDSAFAYNWTRCAWTNLSDCRDKTCVKNLDENLGLNLLRQLTPVSFNFDYRQRYVDNCKYEYGTKDNTLATPKKNYGFLAQELKTVLETLNVEFEALGYDPKNDSYRITYEEFIAPLIKGVQQTLTRLENLESRV